MIDMQMNITPKYTPMMMSLVTVVARTFMIGGIGSGELTTTRLLSPRTVGGALCSVRRLQYKDVGVGL